MKRLLIVSAVVIAALFALQLWPSEAQSSPSDTIYWLEGGIGQPEAHLVLKRLRLGRRPGGDAGVLPVRPRQRCLVGQPAPRRPQRRWHHQYPRRHRHAANPRWFDRITMLFTWFERYNVSPMTNQVQTDEDGTQHYSIVDGGSRFQLITDRVAHRASQEVSALMVNLHDRAPHIGGGAGWYVRRSRLWPLFWTFWKLIRGLESLEMRVLAQLWVIRGICECASEHPNGRHWFDPLTWKALTSHSLTE